jgi:alkylation response protein AidB-like acyl-CoA dehydrogenase
MPSDARSTATAELEAFRDEVRTFLAENLSASLRAKVLGGYELTKEEYQWWHDKLFRRGWSAPAWPAKYGGCAWSVIQQYVFEEECALYGAPMILPVGPGMVGPILIDAGSEEQRQRLLPGILDGTQFWCQGLSEPGSGSDLASLRCRAEKRDDHYVINGSKIWTSFAHWAEWVLLVVRTDDTGRKQQGITLLAVDMKTPGITIRPITSIDGLWSLNQVFFDEVEVPVANRVGEDGEGWSILKRNIGLERLFNGAPTIARILRRRLVDVAGRVDATGQDSWSKPWFREALAQIDVRISALESLVLEVLPLEGLPARPEASLIKVRGTEIQQDITRLITEVCGSTGFVYDRDAIRDGWKDDGQEEHRLSPLVPHYLFMRKASISSGTNEIQRNIIATHVLGPAR